MSESDKIFEKKITITYTMVSAAWTAALLTLTATTGFNRRTAASKGAR